MLRRHQTTIHGASGSSPAVILRLLSFATQMIVLTWMALLVSLLVYRVIAAGQLA